MSSEPEEELGRGRRAKNPNAKYVDSDYVTDSDFIVVQGRKGGKAKARQPRKDEIDVVYDYCGDNICDIKYATTPERVPLWIELIKENYKNVSETLRGGHGKQIKLLESKLKGTIIEIFLETGLIMIKGKPATFKLWAEQEFKIR